MIQFTGSYILTRSGSSIIFYLVTSLWQLQELLKKMKIRYGWYVKYLSLFYYPFWCQTVSSLVSMQDRFHASLLTLHIIFSWFAFSFPLHVPQGPGWQILLLLPSLPKTGFYFLLSTCHVVPVLNLTFYVEQIRKPFEAAFQ